MSDDWQPGDLALCVQSYPEDHVQAGAVNTVETVFDWYGLTGLLLVGVPPLKGPGFDARCFRKIRPHTPDAEDAETIRLLTGKPVHLPA